jgi:8-oxo-dGTP pyrophosphatase MutT (NUDIX family)
MIDPEFVIPTERLPAGFANSIEQSVPNPVTPRPAATAVLMRDSERGIEVLLLKRHRSSGFVPGAYVFPGGRTDDGDADPNLPGHALHMRTSEAPAHYWFAVVREVFEETGVLLARTEDGQWARDTSDAAMETLRLKLMDNTAGLLDIVRSCKCRIDFEQVVYFAHWITPVAEPRRYDTRFFATVLPAGRSVRPDPREMTDALWLPPNHALERFAVGQLPMVFPTVRTLEQLSSFNSTAEALRALRTRAVEPVLPRLVRTKDGVGIVIDPK